MTARRDAFKCCQHACKERRKGTEGEQDGAIPKQRRSRVCLCLAFAWQEPSPSPPLPPSILPLPRNIKALLILPPCFPPASSPLPSSLSLLFALFVLSPWANISLETQQEAQTMKQHVCKWGDAALLYITAEYFYTTEHEERIYQCKYMFVILPTKRGTCCFFFLTSSSEYFNNLEKTFQFLISSCWCFLAFYLTFINSRCPYLFVSALYSQKLFTGTLWIFSPVKLDLSRRWGSYSRTVPGDWIQFSCQIVVFLKQN